MWKNILRIGVLSLVSMLANGSQLDQGAQLRLEAVLAAQKPENQARYEYRHPRQTLEFFGIQPGMVVVEALPGGGWYSTILSQYLGTNGTLIGADYSLDMWPLFPFASDEFMEGRRNWVEQWPAKAADKAGEAGAKTAAFNFGALPDSMAGTADAVLFVRALHNMSRFESKGGFMTAALQDAYNILKPGGVVGVVQHEAPVDMSDDWADGSRGYLKKSAVIAAMKAAGFSPVGDSDINANPKDQPGMDDVVWRLPPSLRGSKDDPDKRARLEAIGESNRMTLLFRKE